MPDRRRAPFLFKSYGQVRRERRAREAMEALRRDYPGLAGFMEWAQGLDRTGEQSPGAQELTQAP